MKQLRPYPFAKVTLKAQHSVESGHPWIYDTEITAPPECSDGDLVDVVGSKGAYLGTGFYNGKSKIRVRLISRNANDRFDEAFFERRLRHAWEYRKTVMGEDVSCCRIVFGEADSFPGLTVDRFGDILVTQTLSLGIEQRKGMLFPLIRELEGLEQGKGFFPIPGLPTPESTRTEIIENGIRYAVDFESGQKTGFFLDQKYNRQAVAKISRGKKV